MNVFPNRLVEVMFAAYCKARGMNPDDWPSIGLEKQNAWLAAANAVAAIHHCASCDEHACRTI